MTNNGGILDVLNVSGTLLGNGSLGALLVNSRELVTAASGTLTLTGAITNNGTLRFGGGAVIPEPQGLPLKGNQERVKSPA